MNCENCDTLILACIKCCESKRYQHCQDENSCVACDRVFCDNCLSICKICNHKICNKCSFLCPNHQNICIYNDCTYSCSICYNLFCSTCNNKNKCTVCNEYYICDTCNESNECCNNCRE